MFFDSQRKLVDDTRERAREKKKNERIRERREQSSKRNDDDTQDPPGNVPVPKIAPSLDYIFPLFFPLQYEHNSTGGATYSETYAAYKHTHTYIYIYA